MPRFLDREGRFGVSTNLKVMYSTLVDHAHLVEVGELEFGRYVLSRQLPHLLIVRDPMQRLRSAFVDKFRVQMEAVGTSRFVGWQRIHRVHYRHLGLDGSESDEVRRHRFLALEFDQFLGLLGKTHLLDGHLRPQVLLEWLRFKRLLPVLPARVARVMKMEELDTEELFDQWGIRTEVKSNSTGSTKIDLDTPSSESLAICRRVYRRDLARYGYGL